MSFPVFKPKSVRKAKLRIVHRDRPKLAVPPIEDTYATLSCGHDILWDDPDEDARGSQFCNACGLWVGVVGFK